jgi:hypothetical protein
MHTGKDSTMMRKYPVLFGMLLSISAHTVIAMTIYTLRSNTISNTKKTIDFPLIDLKWEEPQKKPILMIEENHNRSTPKLTKKQYSTAKNIATLNSTPVDLKPSIYNEMPTYPADAKQQNIEADFNVLLILDKRGYVTQIIFQTKNIPPPLLKAEVIKKLSKWKFTSSHNLANTQINVPIQFKLDV